MQLHTLKRNTKAKRKKRVGRGGPHGKTAGRGHKGQKARSGHRIRPEIRDAIKKLPKRRGYSAPRFKMKPIPVNIDVIERIFNEGDNVTPGILIQKRIVRARGSSAPVIKILGRGTLSKKISVSGCVLSESAKEKVTKAGGNILEK